MKPSGRLRPLSIRAIAVSVVLPLIATSLAALPVDVSTTTAALAYVLAVTAAAAVGGSIAGLTASVISFLGLNFFFTPPIHLFIVTKAEDLIALVVFLLVSATVGTLISTALAQRMRAEARERDVRRAKEEADTNRARAALFSSVTHDLRTPLASITASVTALLSGDVAFSDDDRRELLETIHHEAVRLNRVVGNLLDLSRMRAGTLTPSRELAGIDEVVDAVVGRMEPILGDRRLRVRVADDLPDVPIDVVQIDQVLTNLVENSARFSRTGTPIGIEVTRRDGFVNVAVTDDGPGVPADDRERVFEPFVHSPASTGTGLGLAIARAIVEAHQGRIWIEDKQPVGTSVVFELPVQA